MCVYWKNSEAYWQGEYSDKEHIDSFSIEKHLVKLVGNVCMTVRNDNLLKIAVVRLLQYMETNVKEIKNRCYLPLHRTLSVAIFTLFDFKVLDEKYQLMEFITPQMVGLLLKPVL